MLLATTVAVWQASSMLEVAWKKGTGWRGYSWVVSVIKQRKTTHGGDLSLLTSGRTILRAAASAAMLVSPDKLACIVRMLFVIRNTVQLIVSFTWRVEVEKILDLTRSIWFCSSPLISYYLLTGGHWVGHIT